MNGKISGDMPQQEKEINSTISAAMSRLNNIDRFEKEFAIISDRLQKIGMNINPDSHPSQTPSCGEVKPMAELSDLVDNRRPPGLLGRIFDLGEKSEEFSISIGRQLKAINTNLDYIERFI